MTFKRPSKRRADEMRPLSFEMGFAKHAEGSCLVTCGATKVLCTASISEKVPAFVKGSGGGWVTAEYGMLPRSTHTRTDREAARGKQSGRTQEIQRLIGRSLRAVVDLKKLGERQIQVDCDVLQADGGTRTTAISGAYLALFQACRHLVNKRLIQEMPLVDSVAAVSCGIVEGTPLLDLEYAEDSEALADANFVMTGRGGLVEVQATGESASFPKEDFLTLMTLAEEGVSQVTRAQNQVLAQLLGDAFKSA